MCLGFLEKIQPSDAVVSERSEDTVGRVTTCRHSISLVDYVANFFKVVITSDNYLYIQGSDDFDVMCVATFRLTEPQ